MRYLLGLDDALRTAPEWADMREAASKALTLMTDDG
jgi:hypothetical protein